MSEALPSEPIPPDEKKRLRVKHAEFALVRVMLLYGEGVKGWTLEAVEEEAAGIVRQALASEEERSALNRQIGELQSQLGQLQATIAGMRKS